MTTTTVHMFPERSSAVTQCCGRLVVDLPEDELRAMSYLAGAVTCSPEEQPTTSPAVELPLEVVLDCWQDGDVRGWAEEFAWLESNHGDALDLLTDSIRADGIREPIVLGSDGRVWDGHHRLYVATRLALRTVPVVFPTVASRTPGGLPSLPDIWHHAVYGGA